MYGVLREKKGSNERRRVKKRKSDGRVAEIAEKKRKDEFTEKERSHFC